jgi:aryl-alcohol dehydrogenase-like predicted oxidoreductase
LHDLGERGRVGGVAGQHPDRDRAALRVGEQRRRREVIPQGWCVPVLASPVVAQTAARLGITPAQAALQWLLQLAPSVLLIPGTGSVAHLRENLAAEDITLDDQALRDLDRVSA